MSTENIKKISVVSPVYKAEKIVDELVKEYRKKLSQITVDYEIILVEDCGGDNSWERIYWRKLQKITSE